ncbi:DUF3093 domain-containing protein [Microbacterium oleivorans]|uniref:DUF3093 domain-containing protein n=1 Tax=Microbacterium oleivorans TaxID=273677 RepID=A0A7D5IUE8_9MICO|nr:DUF3093 domain-containing protein [Microbacterium oleivorans]QLD12994.1 DUF3093 domain-containing protein [Microbacterium oleivorans]
MHSSAPATLPSATYRERLSPSLWVLVSAAVCGPMVALVLAPLDTVIGLVAGIVVGALVVAGLLALSPVVEVSDGWLRVGRARVEVRYLGAVEIFVGDDARQARGPGLSPSSWHLLRGGIDGVARVELVDPDDPVSHWVFSTRTPARVAAVIEQARSDGGAATRVSPRPPA